MKIKEYFENYFRLGSFKIKDLDVIENSESAIIEATGKFTLIPWLKFKWGKKPENRRQEMVKETLTRKLDAYVKNMLPDNYQLNTAETEIAVLDHIGDGEFEVYINAVINIENPQTAVNDGVKLDWSPAEPAVGIDYPEAEIDYIQSDISGKKMAYAEDAAYIEDIGFCTNEEAWEEYKKEFHVKKLSDEEAKKLLGGEAFQDKERFREPHTFYYTDDLSSKHPSFDRAYLLHDPLTEDDLQWVSWEIMSDAQGYEPCLSEERLFDILRDRNYQDEI